MTAGHYGRQGAPGRLHGTPVATVGRDDGPVQLPAQETPGGVVKG